MKLRAPMPSSAEAPAAALASIASLAALFLLLAVADGADGAGVRLPESVARAEADRGCACIVLASGAQAPGAPRATRFAFSDGDSPGRPLGAVTDVYLAALRALDSDPERAFAVSADAGVPFALVDDVIEQLRRAGAREVTLLTRAVPAESAP